MPIILQHKVQLTISRERATKLGDYRNAHGGSNHRISINGNLNPYAFLVTLLHELAHLLAFEQYGNRIAPHGLEWKYIYGQVLIQFLRQGIFPPDVAAELYATMHNPGASTCAEPGLQRVLRNYDVQIEGIKLIEQLAEGQHFKIPGGRTFVKGQKLRKRIKCFEWPSMKPYLFSAIYEVLEVEKTG